MPTCCMPQMILSFMVISFRFFGFPLGNGVKFCGKGRRLVVFAIHKFFLPPRFIYIRLAPFPAGESLYVAEIFFDSL